MSFPLSRRSAIILLLVAAVVLTAGGAIIAASSIMVRSIPGGGSAQLDGVYQGPDLARQRRTPYRAYRSRPPPDRPFQERLSRQTAIILIA
jgi:hypothetical protein